MIERQQARQTVVVGPSGPSAHVQLGAHQGLTVPTSLCPAPSVALSMSILSWSCCLSCPQPPVTRALFPIFETHSLVVRRFLRNRF